MSEADELFDHLVEKHGLDPERLTYDSGSLEALVRIHEDTWEHRRGLPHIF